MEPYVISNFLKPNEVQKEKMGDTKGKTSCPPFFPFAFR